MFTRRYFISVAVVTIGASTQFYNYGIVNPEQELLTNWINQTYFKRNGIGLDKTQLNLFWSFVVSSISIGAIFGALLTRYLSERLGRRNALIANGIINIFGALFEYLSNYVESPEFLIIGRIILGMNMGLSSGLVPLYLLEITPNKYRGMAGTLHQVAVAFSDWFSLFMGLPEVLGDENNWPIAFAFPGILALILVIALPFCPESPKFTLIVRGKREQALNDLERLVNKQEAKKMFEALIKESVISQNGAGKYSEIFSQRELRIPLMISVLVMMAQQFTGCSTIFAYSTDMFQNAHLTAASARYSTLAVGIAYFLCACSAPFLIERVGRRCLLIFELGSCTIALFFIAFFTFIQQNATSEWASSATIGALILYMCCYGVGSPVPWMITGEMFPTRYRSSAVTIACFVAWSFAFMISSAYLPFQEFVGVSFSYLPFILFSGINTVAIYFILPETRDKNPTDIVQQIRFRAQSISSGHPFRAIISNPSCSDFNDEESRKLVREHSENSTSSSTFSYPYMSITTNS